jgi:hypothetical protein
MDVLLMLTSQAIIARHHTAGRAYFQLQLAVKFHMRKIQAFSIFHLAVAHSSAWTALAIV